MKRLLILLILHSSFFILHLTMAQDAPNIDMENGVLGIADDRGFTLPIQALLSRMPSWVLPVRHLADWTTTFL